MVGRQADDGGARADPEFENLEAVVDQGHDVAALEEPPGVCGLNHAPHCRGQHDWLVAVGWGSEALGEKRCHHRLCLHLDATDDALHQVRCGRDDRDPAPEQFRVLGRDHRFECDPHRAQWRLVDRARSERDPKGLAASVDLDLEDGFFGREVAVEGSYRDARRGRDLLHGDGVEASLGEELEGNGLQLGGHQARVAGLAAARQRLGHPVSHPAADPRILVGAPQSSGRLTRPGWSLTVHHASDA